MNTENNQEVVVTPEGNEGDGDTTVTLTKEEHTKLNETIGSLKRDLKDAKKTKAPKDEVTPEKTKSDDLNLLQNRLDKQTLRSAKITHEDDVELAQKTAKKWNMELDDVVEDEDFLMKLEKGRDKRATADATSNIKGDKGSTSSKNSTDYWIAKGERPTKEQMPDRKDRVKVIKALAKNASTNGKKFYND